MAHKYEWTEEQDEVIRNCIEHNGVKWNGVRRAVQILGRGYNAIWDRMSTIGLSTPRKWSPHWTDAEMDVLETHAHLSLREIRRRLTKVSPPGVRRTPTAIAGQMTRHRMRSNMDGLRHAPLARALGICATRLHEMREGGQIRGHLLATARPEELIEPRTSDRERWFYRNDDIVRFIAQYWMTLSLRRVDQVWFLSLLISYLRTTPRRSSMPEGASATKERIKCQAAAPWARKRGRPKGSKDTKPRKRYTPRVPKLTARFTSTTQAAMEKARLPDGVVQALRAKTKTLRRAPGPARRSPSTTAVNASVSEAKVDSSASASPSSGTAGCTR